MKQQGDPPERWHFTNDDGTFSLCNPHRTSYLYLPLLNEAGLISSITPTLHGDIKAGQNSYLMPPVSAEDLHNSRSARNFWVWIDGAGAWSVAGNSARQIQQLYQEDEQDEVLLEAGILWQKLTRSSVELGVKAETVSFVPPSSDRVELMMVTVTNISEQPLTMRAIAAIPIFGRSADNLRDHRHVTSLLHRTVTHKHGILVRPTLSFDERGHRPNQAVYGVLGSTGDGSAPDAFCPVIEQFIGEGGNLAWPEAVMGTTEPWTPSGEVFEGMEAIGALRFEPVTLGPGENCSTIIIMAIMDNGEAADKLVKRYGTEKQFARWFQRNLAWWRSKLENLTFTTADEQFDRWIRWVGVQPILRRLSGNSFLPYHDYGRGGRGWRDLWQDSLSLIMMEPEGVADLLWNYYAGVRIDGSNATIIGSEPGEFKADRNDIPRVWMDHGAWPFLTTKLYIDQTGNLSFLLRKQAYFKDAHINRCQDQDERWKPNQGVRLRKHNGKVYKGSILEHILVQHLSAFFNVGQHNIIRMEGADWNDGMDMAVEKGESVAFTALFASNMRQLSQLVRELESLDISEVSVATELLLLLDTLSDPLEYHSVAAKGERLATYFSRCRHTISGKKSRVSIQDLARDLDRKIEWLYQHINTQEWLHNREGFAWFNGYYDNLGGRVEGDHPLGVRMTLTGQVFALLSGIASDEQALQMVQAADRYLLEPSIGGYRLNSNFGEVMLDLGRCFGYAFGHKENGAMFSHMAMMWAYGLYKRGYVAEGFQVLAGIFHHCSKFEVCRIYPGIPEYVNENGRGMYPYLTGSASWLLLTALTEMFGVRGHLGDLTLAPKLLQEQFDERGDAAVDTIFAGKPMSVVYHNPDRLEFGGYQISEVTLDGTKVAFENSDQGIVIARELFTALSADQPHRLDVNLGEP